MTGLILATVAILGGIGGLLTAYQYYRYSMQWQRNHVPPTRWPHVTVIAPHRGPIIRECVDALLAQDYAGTWNIIFATTHKDASYPQLADHATRHEHVQVVLTDDVVQLAKEKSIHRGQKNHNLVTALSKVSPETEVIAVIDSDVCPSPDWLNTLVEPLSDADDRLGATTLARFYVPGSGLASCAQATWILGSAALMVGPWGYVWGGSFAMRREILEKTDVLDRWKGLKGSISSDDLNLSVALKLGHYRVSYVPGHKALRSPPKEGETWSDVLRFTNRQLLHTWWSRRDLWLAAFMTEGMKSIALLGALGIAWLQPVALLALCVPILDILRFSLVVAALRSLDSSNRPFLHSQQKAILAAGPLPSLLCIINTVAAATRTHMEWGGVKYTYRTVVGYTEDDSWRARTTGKPD